MYQTIFTSPTEYFARQETEFTALATCFLASASAVAINRHLKPEHEAVFVNLEQVISEGVIYVQIYSQIYEDFMNEARGILIVSVRAEKHGS